MIAAQTINKLGNPNFNRVFYSENTTWMVSITSMNNLIPSEQRYFTIYKIDNNSGEMKSYQIDRQDLTYSIVNELVYVSDDKIIFAEMTTSYTTFFVTYLLVDGNSSACGYKTISGVHPLEKDDNYVQNRWYTESSIISFGTRNGNIGALWQVQYGAGEDHIETICKVELNTDLSVNNIELMSTETTQDLNAAPNMMKFYYRCHPRYILSQRFKEKTFGVIDTETFQNVSSFSLDSTSVAEQNFSSFNAHLYQDRQEPYADEFYGRRLIGIIGLGNQTQPPNYFKSIHDGYNVIHVDSSGNVGMTRINARIKEIAAIDKYGNIYCSVFSTNWNVVFNKYSSSGALEWSTSNTVYRNRRPDVVTESNSTTQNKVFTRFDENDNLVISSMDGIQEYNFNYTYKYQYAHVINKNNGSTVSSTNNHTLPKYNGYTTVPIVFYEKRDPSSGLVKPVLLAVALRDSKNNENTIATEILTSEMEPFYYFKLSVVDEIGNTVSRNKYKIQSKINGLKASISDGSNIMQLDDIWEIEITSFAYLPETLSGVLSIENRSVKIVLKRRDWTRKRYEIRTPQELQAIGDDDLGDYHIMNDIDMADFHWENIYTDSKKPFLGSINGNGFTIKNLTIHSGDMETADGYGFIGNSFNATFEAMKFENVELNCGYYSGFLTGSLYFNGIYESTTDEVVKPFVNDVTVIDSNMYVDEYSSTVGGFVGVYQSNANMDNEVSTEIIPFTNCIIDNVQINLQSDAYRIGGIVGVVGIGVL